MNQANATDILQALSQVIESRKHADPDKSYVAKLFKKGQDAILKKVGEESTELVMASKDGIPEKIISETADVLFHVMVLLAHHGLSHEQVMSELTRRFGLSGIDEKANRSAD